MEYNYTSRNQLYKKYQDSNQPKGLFFGSDNKEIFDVISAIGWYFNLEKIEKHINKMANSNLEPSAYLKKYHQKLVEFCVTKTYLEDFYGIVSKYNQFPYSRGMGRRTVRTKEHRLSTRSIFELLGCYYRLQFYSVDLASYLKDELSEEKLNFKHNMDYYCSISCLDDMIAGAIDSGNINVIRAIEDIILGESNTAIITTSLIRGIIKSSNTALYKLLGEFLLAARLQEGVRQSVCENMDCGTEAAFLSLFQVIYKNNLIRYSSIKRAVGTWIGIMDYEDTDRIMGKVLDTMNRCLFTEGESQKCVQSQDAIEIMVGLWCIGSHEISDAVNIMRQFLMQGSRQQKLVMSYYNREIYFEKFSNEIAMKAIENHSDDMEIIAAFYYTYLANSEAEVRKVIEVSREGENEKITVSPLSWERYFDSAKQAEKHFEILNEMISRINGKKKTYDPFIFPWYSVELTRSNLIANLCMIAYMLKDNAKKDYAAEMLSKLEPGYRSNYVKLLLCNAETPFQRNCLLQALGDREEYTRRTAFNLLKNEQFRKEEDIKLLELLRFKNHEIRQNILYLLQKSEDARLEELIKILAEDKREEMRLAGLDLVLQLQKEDKRKSLYEKVCPTVFAIENPTERELILIKQLTETQECEEGNGLYTDQDKIELPPILFDPKDYPLFLITSNRLNGLFAELNSFIHEHREEKVIDHRGEEHILGNCKSSLPNLVAYNQPANVEKDTAFISLWKEFYEKHIADFQTLYAMYASLLHLSGNENYEGGSVWEECNRKLLGDAVFQMDASGYEYGPKIPKSYGSIFYSVLSCLIHLYSDREYCRNISKKVCSFIVNEVPKTHRWLQERRKKDAYIYGNPGEYYTSQLCISTLAQELKENGINNEEWKEHFLYLYEVDHAFEFYKKEEENNHYFYAGNEKHWLNPFDYMKAYYLKIITSGQMYRVLFEEMDLRSTLSCFKNLISGKRYYMIKKVLGSFQLLEEETDFDQDFYDIVVNISDTITDVILDIELKRGDTPTKMSEYVSYLPPVKGSLRLKQMLVALGKDKLVRDNYIDTNSKNGSLSCLIRNSCPLHLETAQDMAESLKGTTITKKRLIETAMFASEWLDLLEEYLEIPGFKSGTYYFMAHMDDYINEKRAAMIAKYTPLSGEELREGAFDINWFRDVHDKLGEEILVLLYDAAKYISYGSKHTRARKYADAAMGRLVTKDTKLEIKEKRNKDLLMALGLIPFLGKEDMVDRYEFIRTFRKESKEFGSMRRASEEHAADMALKNMAMAAGYQDVTRLILAMEGELTEGMKECFEWKNTQEGYQVKLELTEAGKVGILCQKGDKTLKTIPAVLKKNETMLSLKSVQKKWKEQYSRTVSMLEKAMEDREAYSLLELKNLRNNLVTGPIIQNLVFTGKDKTEGICGFVTEKGFVNREGKIISTKEELLLYVAHPYELYQSGEWHEFQKLFFRLKSEEKRVQPFRQVYRELYVKLDEEKKALSSKMFAGNQIQPARAAACLKKRGWVADYEEGLQKIYYRDNVVARIYALADWFSPSDIEAPTLEWVEFSNRVTFQSIPIGEVPDILYSEVMRDVDLAVSVAHAGSVDPETSHSTVEMRQVIVLCNMELFGLTNVRIDGSHAMIQGKKGEYTVHLGSGVIHKVGSHQINVLPVHSQSRGKLFLPFVDEDPKTAEIMSKILLFAQDHKIKDPYILSQL